MPIISRGDCSNSTVEDIDQDWLLFCQNIDLLLMNEQKILNVADHFFCSPAFSSCSFPYISGDGKLFLGHLLLGWQSNILIEKCPACALGKILITSFSGSPLSGNNAWTGFCLSCLQKQKGIESKYFRHWMNLVMKFRQSFPDKVSEVQEYDSQEFTFGGNGLKPVRKKKTVWKQIAESVSLSTVINELKSGNIRRGKSPNIQLLKMDLTLKLSSNATSQTIHIRQDSNN